MPNTAVSINDQAAYLKANNFWIGRTYSENFVKNLYDLASRNVITSEQWNTYGNAARSWDKQSRAILTIAKIASPANAADTEEKAAVLKINGYWIDGKAVGEGVIDNLYDLHTNGKITADEWNKLGAATLPWDKQSTAITSRLDRPVGPETDTPPVVETPVEEPPALDIPEEVVPEEAIPAVVEETVEEEAVPAVTEEAVPEEVSEEDQQATADVAGDDGISKQAEELDAAKMTEQELRDALTNDPVLRLALRRLSEQGLAKNSEGLLRIIDEVECAPADTAKPAPAPAESAPQAAPAVVNPAEAPETKTEVAEELSAEEKQKQIGELLELRETVKNLIYMKEWRNPQYIKEKIKHKRHFLQLQREKIEEIDAQISALDPQAVPRDRVLWKPWTWDMFNN